MFQGISKQTWDNYYAGVFLLLSPLNTTNRVDKSCRALDSLKKPLSQSDGSVPAEKEGYISTVLAYHLFHFFSPPSMVLQIQ